jgi:hypothetical protein
VVLFITTHSSTNVLAYSDDGALLTSEVLQGGPSLSELRGLAVVSGTLLWVVSGSQSDSLIAAYTRDDENPSIYNYKASIAAYQASIAATSNPSQSGTTLPLDSLLHPFDFTFDGSDCYVSNQDTNVVVHLIVATDYLSATAGPVAPALTTTYPNGNFLAATFVASATVVPSARQVEPVPTPAGLEVSFTGSKVSNSVRGVVVYNDQLLVADEVANVVKVYDTNGNFQAESNPLTGGGPVHLMISDGVLYVANGNNVFAASLQTTSAPSVIDLQPVAAIEVPKVSGMALGPDSSLYCGSRDQSAPRIYPYSGFPDKLNAGNPWELTDMPEFVLYVADAAS